MFILLFENATKNKRSFLGSIACCTLIVDGHEYTGQQKAKTGNESIWNSHKFKMTTITIGDGRFFLTQGSQPQSLLKRQKTVERTFAPPIVDRQIEILKKFEGFRFFDNGIEDAERILVFGYRDNVITLGLNRKL